MDVWGTYGAGFAEPSSARYKQTVAPTAEPVTLDEIKQHVTILDNSQDEYLNGLIGKARRTIQQRINRQIMPATYVLSLDAFPDEIMLEMLPVTAVTAINYIDYAGNAQLLPANQYQVDLSSPDRPCRIRPVWGLIWPITRVGTFNAVTVTFSAGYASISVVPPTLKHAIAMLAAQWFRYREPVAGEPVNLVPLSLDWVLDSEQSGVYA